MLADEQRIAFQRRCATVSQIVSLRRRADDDEFVLKIILKFIRRAVEIGGTISAEHGIGKLKREYLKELYGEAHLREMANLKLAFDPAGILGRGNMFVEETL